MNQKAAIIKANPNKIRLINREISNNFPLIAGYVGFDSIKEFKKFLVDSDASQTILFNWTAEHHNGIGIMDKDASANWLKATLLIY